MNSIPRRIAVKLGILREKQYSKDLRFDINGILLKVKRSDEGGLDYRNRSHFENVVDLFWAMLAKEFSPKLIIDIGANYGFTGALFSKHFPLSKIIAIEPNPGLRPYIEENFNQNGVKNATIITSFVNETDKLEDTFHINLGDSQDSRVSLPNDISHEIIKISSISLNSILRDNPTNGNIFIKVDTQGFEPQVVRGGLEQLKSMNNWMMRIEFAPSWLQSQGNDPISFLKFLINEFNIYEAVSRTTFNSKGLEEIINPAKILKIEQVDEFINHITSLNKSGTGWCDLLILPK
jgi:FkbM family methyltransferase